MKYQWTTPLAKSRVAHPNEFDETFSLRTLAFLEEAIPTLSGRDQDNMKCFLTGEVDIIFACQALEELWNHPQMNASFRAASSKPKSQKMDLSVLYPSLLMWSFNQPWSAALFQSEAKMKKLLNNTFNECVLKKASWTIDWVNNACMFLDHFHMDAVPTDKKASLAVALASKFDQLIDVRYGDKSVEHQLSRPYQTELLLKVGSLATPHGNSIAKQSIPLPEHWVRRAKAMLARNEKEQDPHDFPIKLLQSDIGHDFQARVLEMPPGFMWTAGNIIPRLMAELPANELERFALLPWDEQSAELNQKVLSMYCPKAAPLVLALATQSDWLNKGAMAQLVVATTHQETLPVYSLPDGLVSQDASASVP